MADYWKKRQEQLNHAAEKDEAELKKRLSALYSSEEKKLNREIASYYTMYGRDNIVEYRQLLQQLSNEDYRLLMERMDDFAKKYPQYKHLIPVRESIYKLNRLEGLEYSVQMQQLEMGIKERAAVEAHLLKQAERNFTTVQTDLGMGKAFNTENASIIRDMVYTKWSDSKNFSDRIWGNRQKLSNMLNTTIAQGFAKGTNYQKMVRLVSDRFDVARNDIYRLIYTEGTFVMNESRARAVQDVFEYYHLSCLPGACSTCLDVEAQTITSPIPFRERMDGENFPPIHPWCRCGFEIVVPNQQQWIDDYVSKRGGDPGISEYQRRQAEEILAKFDEKGKMVANGLNPDIMRPGATSGALTDRNDPFYQKRERHAQAYYESVRNSKKVPVVKIISRNTGMSESSISKVYDHVFINKYNLYGGNKRFDPDYDMAESFRRLREGKEIQEHDLIMLKHERLEYGLMNKLGLPYEQAHALAQRKHNYKKALDVFKDNRGL